MDNSRFVYSTEVGKLCPLCQKPVSGCACKKKKSRSQPILIQGDHRDTLVTELKKRGFKAKIAGG